MVLEVLVFGGVATVPVEVNACAVHELRAGAVPIGHPHVEHERGSFRTFKLISLVGWRDVIDVVALVLEVVALPLAGARGEALLNAAVLEAHGDHPLALLEAEVGHVELGGFGGAYVLSPQAPTGVIDGSAVVAKGFFGRFMIKPRVGVPVGACGVGVARVDVIS